MSQKESFVILFHQPSEVDLSRAPHFAGTPPVQVYGTFNTEEEARAYAIKRNFDEDYCYFRIHQVLDVNEEAGS
jgi:hypothetical protein